MARFALNLAAAAALGLLNATAIAQQVNIPRIEAMPAVPPSYQMKDWKATAQQYDALVFDFSATGPYKPLIWWDTTHINNSRDMFGLPSYVGSYVQTGGNAHESINCMAAVFGATFVGIDKSNQGGQNFVLQEQGYYNTASGEGVVLNNVWGDTGGSFWYEVVPGIYFSILTAQYPSVTGMDAIMFANANKWYAAEVYMGGNGATPPDFNYTGFDFDTNSPNYNGLWREPDGAAGIAYIQLMAYKKFGQAKYLEGADWGMQFLQNRPVNQNPYYETLLNFGAYVAARMNAEYGRSYDVEKIINWCFEPTSVVRPDWGVALGSWNGYPVDGLAASVSDGGGYAFAMDTFNQFGQMVPLVRYDNRFARAIGRYALNAASNSRFFYANGIPFANQSGAAWASESQNVVSYEGFRKQGKVSNKAVADYAHTAGTVVSGTYADTRQLDNTNQVLREAVAGTFDSLYHVWEFDVPSGTNLVFGMWGWRTDAGDADGGFRFSYSANPGGPWTNMFTINDAANQWHGYPVSGLGAKCYIRVEDTDHTPGNTSLDTLYVAMMYLAAEQPSVSPYAMGDPVYAGWGATDYGLYGASHVGIFGGIIAPTNIAQILQLDLLKTDILHDPAFPSYLYYNPLGTPQTVNIDVGTTATSLYDAVSNSFLRTNVTGATNFQVPADSSVVLTLVPANGTITYAGGRMLVNGIVADYSATPPSGVGRWELY